MEQANTRHASYTTPTQSPTTNLQPDLLHKKVGATNNMINHLISDYEGNEKAAEGYCRLVVIDNAVKDIFDELGSFQLKNSDAQLLSDLCRRLNEDPVLQEIRDSHLEERLTGEGISRLPTLNIQNMSSLPGSPMRPKKSARMGHSRTTLDFMQPKDAAHEIPVLQAEDIHSSGGAAQPEHDPIYVVANEEEIKKAAEIKIQNIHKLDVEIQEIVNHSLTRLETRRTETCQEQTEEELRRNVHEERKKYIANLFAQMNDEYGKHRIEFSHKYYNEIIELGQSKEYTDEKLFLTQQMEEHKVLMDDVDSTYKEVLRIIAELDDENGYELEKAKKNVAIKYKNLPAGGVSLKLEATVDVPLFNLLALNYEAEGFAKWTPFCKESKLVKRLSRASNAMWLKWDMPPPVSSREGYLIGSGFDRLDINGSILMIAKTIHKDPKLAERYGIDIPAKSKHVKMELPYIGVDLVPISKTQTKMRLVTTFDPQIKFVPLSLTSWIARKGSIFLLDSMVKYAASLEGETWKVYLERSKDFYDWLQTLLDEHLKN